MPPIDPTPKNWHWMFHAEVNWRRMGIGVEVVLGYWYPREWSIYLALGPILVCFGRAGELRMTDPTPTPGYPTAPIPGGDKLGFVTFPVPSHPEPPNLPTPTPDAVVRYAFADQAAEAIASSKRQMQPASTNVHSVDREALLNLARAYLALRAPVRDGAPSEGEDRCTTCGERAATERFDSGEELCGVCAMEDARYGLTVPGRMAWDAHLAALRSRAPVDGGAP